MRLVRELPDRSDRDNSLRIECGIFPNSFCLLHYLQDDAFHNYYSCKDEQRKMEVRPVKTQKSLMFQLKFSFSQVNTPWTDVKRSVNLQISKKLILTFFCHFSYCFYRRADFEILPFYSRSMSLSLYF